MKKKTWLVGTIALAVTVGFGARFLTSEESTSASVYRTGAVRIGTVESTVTATGRLTALQSVAVGTQVSGQVMQLYADYNDQVLKGQLLARIDPTLQEQSLRNAEASLQRVEAALAQSERDYERSKTLYDQQIITEVEFNQAEYSVTVAKSNLISAEVSREQAARNLSYTEIYSPIDGVVMERNVETGQTVAASMSAPQLYLLATDLSQIEILVSVDESDISSIVTGMPVRFTVSAYPDDSFEGTVRQVRLASATQENVVNYTAVISVANTDMRLAPGMTAEVDFIVEQAEDAFLVPNAALRFRATDEMIAQLTDPAMIELVSGTPARQGMSDGAGDRAGMEALVTAPTPKVAERNPDVFVLGGGAGAAPTRSMPGRLWYLKDGKLGVLDVRTGISDGTMTAVTGAVLEEGMEIIIGLTQPETTTTQPASNPFQGGAQGPPSGGFGPPAGGGFGPR